MHRLVFALTLVLSLLCFIAPTAQAIFMGDYVYEEGGSWFSKYTWQATRYKFLNGVKTSTLENFTFDKMVFTICWPETQSYDGTGANPYVYVEWAKQSGVNKTWTRTSASPKAVVIQGQDLTGSAGQIRTWQKFNGVSPPTAGLHIYQRAYDNGVLKEFADLRLNKSGITVENYKDYMQDIPEPSSMLLLLVGAGLAMRARRRSAR